MAVVTVTAYNNESTIHEEQIYEEIKKVNYAIKPYSSKIFKIYI